MNDLLRKRSFGQLFRSISLKKSNYSPLLIKISDLKSHTLATTPVLGQPPRKTAVIRGFTLIEMMVVLAIIGIMVSVVVPNYTRSIVNLRRMDAHHLLHTNAQVLQRCLTLAGSFVGCNPISTSKDGYYTLTSTLNVQSWTLQAKPVTTKSQSIDADCTSMSLNNIGQKSATGLTPKRCW